MKAPSTPASLTATFIATLRTNNHVVFYNGLTSRASRLRISCAQAASWLIAFARAVDGPNMINVATDGETYGHHFKFGDLCLAYGWNRCARA